MCNTGKVGNKCIYSHDAKQHRQVQDDLNIEMLLWWCKNSLFYWLVVDWKIIGGDRFKILEIRRDWNQNLPNEIIAQSGSDRNDCVWFAFVTRACAVPSGSAWPIEKLQIHQGQNLDMLLCLSHSGYEAEPEAAACFTLSILTKALTLCHDRLSV